jgi:hypothetical protein
MSDKKFTVYPGKFPCHTCKEEVRSMRYWVGTAKVTFMCSQKHISEVFLVKTKQDYLKEVDADD